MLLDHVVGIVGELGLAQTFQSHVILPVEETDIRAFLPQIERRLRPL